MKVADRRDRTRNLSLRKRCTNHYTTGVCVCVCVCVCLCVCVCVFARAHARLPVHAYTHLKSEQKPTGKLCHHSTHMYEKNRLFFLQYCVFVFVKFHDVSSRNQFFFSFTELPFSLFTSVIMWSLKRMPWSVQRRLAHLSTLARTVSL